jgi:multidrug efflux pump subunit AcrA (membrane-fusion protein)
MTWFKAKKNRRVIAIVAAVLFFFPTHLTITAPAEIVAASSKVISIPYDGVLEKITIKPGEAVKQGDVIALMDHTTIEAQVDQAQQALNTAQVSLSKTGIESLRDQDSRKKADLQLLRAEIATKRIELDYAKTLFDKTSIKALSDGVAIFADSNSLEGKPMKTGEKLMLIADPDDAELLIRAPIDSLLPISEKSKTSFYLNVTPLSSYKATIKSIGYQASPDPDGLLTYKIRADIKQQDKNLRIGWKGTAKIKSNWSILGYAALRKPLIALRNLLGL